MKPQYIQALRKEAEEQAKKILKDQEKFSGKEFAAKENTIKKFKRSKHVLLNQSKIDYCINNGLDIMYLYEELDKKFNGLVEKEPKKYYQPNGNKRGRPKKEDNEQG